MTKYLAVIGLVCFSTIAVAQTDSELSKKIVKGDNAGCGCCTSSEAQTTSPIILALDLDKDGQISAAELKNATQSLSALDSNSDGVISREEMHATDKFAQVNKGEAKNKSARQLGMTKRGFVRRMLQMYDKNNNRKLEIEELPDTMLAVLETIDRNNDQVLTELELLDMNNQIRRVGDVKNLKAKLRAGTASSNKSVQGPKVQGVKKGK
jgi:Ca2+-binding EF-hand superfamily protein